MYDFSDFPSVCRVCFKPTQDCNTKIAVADNATMTYETLLDEITFVPHKELLDELPAYLCNDCAHRLDDFVQLKQQSTLILHFCIALVNGKKM